MLVAGLVHVSVLSMYEYPAIVTAYSSLGPRPFSSVDQLIQRETPCLCKFVTATKVGAHKFIFRGEALSLTPVFLQKYMGAASQICIPQNRRTLFVEAPFFVL